MYKMVISYPFSFPSLEKREGEEEYEVAKPVFIFIRPLVFIISIVKV